MTDDTTTSPALCPVTSPEGRVDIDFDHLAPDYSDNWSDRLNQLAGCRVAHSAHHDGFWMITGHEELRAAAADWEHFSSLHDGVAGDAFAARDQVAYPEPRTPRGGSMIPAASIARMVPSEADGPMHTDIRRLEVPFFTPKAVRSHEQQIRTYVDEALDAVIETGRIDFAADLGRVIPTKVTISVIGFDPDEWHDFAAVVHAMNLHGIFSPDFPFEALFATQAKVLELVKARRENPQDDVASALTRGSVLSSPVTDEEAATILNGLTFAATDTTTSALLHSLRWLSAHPEERELLSREPERIPAAIEEFLRFYSPFFGIARTVAADIEIGGQSMAEGDRVMLTYAAANRDARTFEDPDRVDLTRANASEHVAFGAGPHRCLGAPLARLELRIMLERILERIPDFHVLEDDVVEYPIKSTINGIDQLPATFTPSTRVGAVH